MITSKEQNIMENGSSWVTYLPHGTRWQLVGDIFTSWDSDSIVMQIRTRRNFNVGDINMNKYSVVANFRTSNQILIERPSILQAWRFL